MLFFVQYRGYSAVPGNNLRVIGQGQDFFPDIAHQIVMIAAFEIRAAYAFVKNHIPRHQQADLFAIKYHMPRRMPRNVQYFEFVFAQGQAVAILQPAVGHKGR